tara:strand:- start:2858 stop:3268 length:411 start_codon:yes stop_codon:yes gene_type:complete
MADILQFPNRRQQTDAELVAKLELRLQEIATEGEYITDDIIYLQDMREKGKNEAEDIIKQLAHLNAKGAQTELLDKIVDDFVDERGLTDTQKPKTDTATEKWEDLADKTLDTSLTLLEEAIKKLKDDFNNDKPKDK